MRCLSQSIFYVRVPTEVLRFLRIDLLLGTCNYSIVVQDSNPYNDDNQYQINLYPYCKITKLRSIPNSNRDYCRDRTAWYHYTNRPIVHPLGFEPRVGWIEASCLIQLGHGCITHLHKNLALLFHSDLYHIDCSM